MPTGQIEYFNVEKGFGFIAQDNGEEDVFLHDSSIEQWECDELAIGQRAKYGVVGGKRELVVQEVHVFT